jgi:CHAT domain-containing protein/tetratricopeptide (TPR) repeat protein
LPSLADPVERANAALRDGRLREGRDLLVEAIEDPARSTDERAGLLMTLAHAEVNLGRYVASLDAARRALTIYEDSGDAAGTAKAHLRIGNAHDELAQYDEAHRHFAEALGRFRELGDRAGEALVVSSLGTSHRFLGSPVEALEYHSAAHEMLEELEQTSRLVPELRHLGSVLEDLGRDDEARDRYEAALDLLRGVEPAWERSALLFHLGRLEGRTGSTDRALELLANGLRSARRTENRWAEARILVEIGRLHAGRGDWVAGRRRVEAGLELLQTMGARDLEWEARYVLASILEDAGELDAARSELDTAVEGLESLRRDIGLPLLRSRYTPRARPVYEAVLRLEAGEGEATDAVARSTFAIAERNRARVFTEMLLESRELRADDASPLHDEERTLRGKITALRTRLIALPHTVADRPALEDELRAAETRYTEVVAELSDRDPRFGSSSAPTTATAEDASRLLSPDAALVAYHLGETESFGWLVCRESVRMFRLPPRRDVENLVLLFRSLTLHRDDPEALAEVATRLHALLLEPVAGQLDGHDRLIVVPDGALFFLPFEALRSSRDRLVVLDRIVSYAPSSAALAELSGRVPRTVVGLLAFGDPGLDETRGEPRLERSASEVATIADMFGRLAIRRTGDQATEAEFRAHAPHPTAAIHLASHAVLDGVKPERSGILFSPGGTGQDDGFLGLFEILGLRLDADLVVLSGCDTARGELLRGEGVLGLTRGFLHAGGRAVVSSLWQVDDAATEQLMVSLYGFLARGHTAATALTLAKRDHAQRASATDDPYSWAGFVLVGDGSTRIEIPAWDPRNALLSLGVGIVLIGFAVHHWRNALE